MSSADLFEDGFPHGTREGYEKGCHGGACPEVVEGRRSCRDANMAYAGDQVYRHRVNAGMSPVQIAAEEAEDRRVEKMAGAPSRPGAKPRMALVPPAPAPVPVAPAMGNRSGPAGGVGGRAVEPVAAMAIGYEDQPAEASEGGPSSPSRAPRTPFTSSELARLRELHATGLSDTEIAKAIGRSQAPTSSHLRKMGLPPNGKRVGVNAPPAEPEEPAEAIAERTQEVRAEGILSDLEEARATAERLAGELDTATADLAIAQAANGTLTGQLADSVRKVSKLEEELLQVNLTRDVEKSAAAHQPSGAELVSAPSAPVAIVHEDQPAGFAGLGLDIDPSNAGGVRVRLHGAQPIQSDLQFTDGALRDVGVKIGA